MQYYCQKSDREICQMPIADQPNDRTLDGPPFISCGIDMFSPFLIKEGRKELKRYMALFTCLASRAVHTECTCGMDIDSFLQSLWQFIARSGNSRVLCSDNGSNFVGAQKEIGNAFKEMDHQKIQYFLQNIGADYPAQKPTSIQSHGRCLGEAGPVSTDHSAVSLKHTWKIIKWWIIQNTAGRSWGCIKLQVADCWHFGRCPKQTTTMSKQYPYNEV